MPSTIRLASKDDAAVVAGIYGPFCESTAVSFEYAAPSTEEIATRIRTITAQFPWLVLDDNGVVAGYAYASRHRERAAYGWSVDTAAYVSPTHRRCGVGRALYTTLFQLLRLQGYFRAHAGISLPNPASTGLHDAVGFTLVGVYQRVGYKHGAWHDVAWYQLALQPERLNPAPPVPVSALAESPGWVEAVSQGLGHYRPRNLSIPLVSVCSGSQVGLSVRMAQPLRVPDVEAQRLAMKKLDFLIGKWVGEARVLRGPGEPVDLVQTEEAQYKLDGLILLIEGIGRDRSDGRVALQALGMISYDDENGTYRMRAFNDGRFLETEVRLSATDNAITWGFALGEIKTSSVLRISDQGEWTERAELTIGSQSPRKLMELTVSRQPGSTLSDRDSRIRPETGS